MCVWGEICGKERTPFVILNGNVTAQCYTDDILRATVLPFHKQQPRDFSYQHDNVIPQTARIVHNVIGANNANVVPRPACRV